METEPTVTLEQKDAFEAIQNVESNSFEAAVIDYPWQFDTANGTDRFGHDQTTGDSDLYETEDHEGLRHILQHTVDAVSDGGWVFIFTDDEVYPEFRNVVEQVDGLIRRQTVFWDSVCMGMGYYHRIQAYPILTATVGDTDRYVQGRPNIYEAKLHSPSAEYHTMKPVELYRQLLESPVLEDGESVLEPFAGTFPSGKVAQERGLGALGWELSDEGVEVAEERLSQRTL